MPGNHCYVPEELGETFYIATIADTIGIDWIYTIPDGYEYELRAVWMRFTADATVVTRVPMFVTWRAADGIDLTRQRLLSLTAGVTRNYCLYAGSSRIATVQINSIVSGGLPTGRLTAGDRFGGTGFTNLDRWRNIRVLVTRWRI